MSMIPWQAWQDLSQWRDDVFRFYGHPSPAAWEDDDHFWEQQRPYGPRVDLSQSEDRIIVEVDLPGVDPKELEVSIEEMSLFVSGSFKNDRRFRDENFFHRERSAGNFRRIIHLPAQVNPQNSSASYKNGVLRVEMPKSRKQRQKISLDVKQARTGEGS
ncbi:MAG: Hsp20/alpha crystallin family protein [Chloroflexi bacterium]|nr:Hsp20/alpha crystallin family protein [Chloroflexota bacterium]